MDVSVIINTRASCGSVETGTWARGPTEDFLQQANVKKHGTGNLLEGVACHIGDSQLGALQPLLEGGNADSFFWPPRHCTIVGSLESEIAKLQDAGHHDALFAGAMVAPRMVHASTICLALT